MTPDQRAKVIAEQAADYGISALAANVANAIRDAIAAERERCVSILDGLNIDPEEDAGGAERLIQDAIRRIRGS